MTEKKKAIVGTDMMLTSGGSQRVVRMSREASTKGVDKLLGQGPPRLVQEQKLGELAGAGAR